MAPLKIEVNDFFLGLSAGFPTYSIRIFLVISPDPPPLFFPQPNVSPVQDTAACFEQFFIVSTNGVLIRDLLPCSSEMLTGSKSDN